MRSSPWTGNHQCEYPPDWVRNSFSICNSYSAKFGERHSIDVSQSPLRAESGRWAGRSTQPL